MTRLAGRYSLTIAQAAKAWGVGEGVLDRAIAEGWLACWMKDGEPHLDPRSVASFRRLEASFEIPAASFETPAASPPASPSPT